MDDKIQVPLSFLTQLRGFINIFASECDVCYRSKSNCIGCVYGRAKKLIIELDHVRDVREEQYFIDNPFEERMHRIIKAIQQAGRPVLSKEIYLPDVYRGLKRWTLKTMCERNILGSTVGEDGHYRFYIKKGLPKSNPTNKKQLKKKGKNYGI